MSKAGGKISDELKGKPAKEQARIKAKAIAKAVKALRKRDKAK